MLELLMKQAGTAKTTTAVVRAGSRIVHHRPENRVEVVNSADIVENEFDLALGTVYVMNQDGKTIDKYDSNGAPPTSQKTGLLTGYLDEYFFSFAGSRWITVDGKTYQFPTGDYSINLIAVDETNRTLGSLILTKWYVMKEIGEVRSLFRQLPEAATLFVIGHNGTPLTECEFVLEPHCVNHRNPEPVSFEESLKLFGPNFKLVDSVQLTLKGKAYATVNGKLCRFDPHGV